MDTIDRYDAHLPAQFSDTSLRLPASIPTQDLAIAGEAKFDPHVILRGFVRHWWQILLFWLALGVPIASLIYWFIKPTYEAFSILLWNLRSQPVCTVSRCNQ